MTFLCLQEVWTLPETQKGIWFPICRAPFTAFTFWWNIKWAMRTTQWRSCWKPFPALARSGAQRSPGSPCNRGFGQHFPCTRHIWRPLWFCYLTLPTLKWGRTDFKLASFFFLNFKKKISHWAIFKIQETHTWKTLKRSEFLFLPAALFCLVKSSAAHGKFSNDWLEGGVWVAGFSGDVSLKEQFARSPPLGRELCYTRGVADD